MTWTKQNGVLRLEGTGLRIYPVSPLHGTEGYGLRDENGVLVGLFDSLVMLQRLAEIRSMI